MKLFLGIILALLVLAFAVPVLAEGSTNICLDVMLHSGEETDSFVPGSSSGVMYSVIESSTRDGRLGSAEEVQMARLHPDIPPVLSCTADFWASI